ncbi:MAG: DUF882 domain-containing protein [Gemmatimonadaceae bacterium]|nr:DUF882 domain-containing protein [Gemmatimonadaceae bacterium]
MTADEPTDTPRDALPPALPPTPPGGDPADVIADETHVPEIPARHRARGISQRAQRRLEIGSNIFVTVLAASWIAAVIWGEPRTVAAADPLSRATRAIGASLTNANAPSAAFITDAMVQSLALRGASGKLLARFETPGDLVPGDSLPAGTHLAATDPASPRDTVPAASRPAGIWRLALAVGNAIRPVADFSLITMRPFDEKQRGRIGGYMIGSWPGESGQPMRSRYENPRGFIEVTLANRDTRVSEHFRLRDFLTKGQENVWPKYLVLEPRLIDKLELLISELERSGVRVEHMAVMSGFRTPSYNAGGGNTAGRANLSRHMYGDAADVFVDNDRNGTLDDLNGDGRVDTRDAKVMADAAERVERAHPHLVGGIGTYKACCGHGPFIHVDTRGYRARWSE